MTIVNAEGAVLDGFSITNGRVCDIGGGIFCSSATITNCIISGNSATFAGGGVYCDYGSLSITNCTISDNSAAYGGGILHFSSSTYATVKNSIVWENSAPDGSEIYFASIDSDSSAIYDFISVTWSDVKGG